MAPATLEIDGVGRTFGVGRRQVTALRDVSFSVGQGELVGLLGRNGAGKTTLTKIVGTLLLPTRGSVRLRGIDVVRDPRSARAATAVVLGGERGLYGRLTGRENIEFFAMIGGLTRGRLRAAASKALDDAGLSHAADRAVETYSKGMRQRLHLAIGLIRQPHLLLLDEPTVGLDPVEADRLRSSIAALRDDGVTVLLTSHYLLDIERLADRVVILGDATVSAQLTVNEFRHHAGYTAVVDVRGTGGVPGRITSADSGLSVVDVHPTADGWAARIRVRDWNANRFAQLAHALRACEITGVTVDSDVDHRCFAGRRVAVT